VNQKKYIVIKEKILKEIIYYMIQIIKKEIILNNI